MAKKVTSIKNLFGDELPLDKMEIIHIGKDNVLAKFKGYGFIKNYGPWDGYTVTIEET